MIPTSLLYLPDAVIAGICIVHELTLATYNTKHYPISGFKFHPPSPIQQQFSDIFPRRRVGYQSGTLMSLFGVDRK